MILIIEIRMRRNIYFRRRTILEKTSLGIASDAMRRANIRFDSSNVFDTYLDSTRRVSKGGEERTAASPRYRLESTLVIGNERLADMARNLCGNEVTNK